jgi:hypothetical protein
VVRAWVTGVWGVGSTCSSNQPGTSQTGIVTVNRPLDRERIPEYRLTVSVKDNPENPRIARKVRLQDTEVGWGKRGGEGKREGEGVGKPSVCVYVCVCERERERESCKSENGYSNTHTHTHTHTHTPPLVSGWQLATGLEAHICLSKRWLQISVFLSTSMCLSQFIFFPASLFSCILESVLSLAQGQHSLDAR